MWKTSAYVKLCFYVIIYLLTYLLTYSFINKERVFQSVQETNEKCDHC